MNLLSILCVLLLAACSTGNGKQMPRSVPVVAENADRKDIPLQLKAIGNVEPFNAVTVKALVGGEISGVFFKEGQDVRKDALLFKIDARPYEAALKQAEATLAKDVAQAKNAKNRPSGTPFWFRRTMWPRISMTSSEPMPTRLRPRSMRTGPTRRTAGSSSPTVPSSLPSTAAQGACS